jgi:hypothetical protein
MARLQVNILLLPANPALVNLMARIVVEELPPVLFW